MRIFLAYIQFLIKSTNAHGVHSPFVYQLVTNCFYNKKKYPWYSKIKLLRKRLFQNKNKISVTDFGAGSRVFTSNEREISAIASNAGMSYKRSKLLSRLIRFLEVKNALELGTSLGMGAAAMAIGNKNVHITTLEGCSNTAKVAKENLDFFSIKNVDIQVGNFEDILPKLQKKWDLVYFDGNHQKEATLKNFNLLLSSVHNDSVFIFDDIHWSKEMEEAWEEIKKHPEVKVSIDTFQWGFIFFRKEQAKEHFIIRL